MASGAMMTPTAAMRMNCSASSAAISSASASSSQAPTRSTPPTSSAIPCCSLPSLAPRSLNLSSKSSFSASRLQLSHTRRDGAGVGARALSSRGAVTVRADGGQGEVKKTNATTGFRTKSPKDTNVVIVGATGYIGKFVVKEMVKRGYNVVAVSREKSGIGGKSDKEKTQAELAGATVCFSDVTDAIALENALKTTRGGGGVDVVISCLASRGGGVKDSWLVDYTATRNSLDAGRTLGASHFVLLSAICVQRPLLEFQRAKLKFEEELKAMAETEEGLGFTYSIVRPTAFFKSLGGQVKSVQGGGPYVMFGDGALTACKPISEADLARFIADCASDEEKVNKMLPIGGPGKALTPLEQGEMLFRILGKEPKFIKVPIQIMDFFIGQLDFWRKFFPNLEDPAEFGKIGRYYAAESMLVLNPESGKYDADATPSYGSDTLEDFFERVVRDGMVGQELGDQAVF